MAGLVFAEGGGDELLLYLHVGLKLYAVYRADTFGRHTCDKLPHGCSLNHPSFYRPRHGRPSGGVLCCQNAA